MLEEDELFHYGTPRHSGRYPWGSGKNPYQRSVSFLGFVDEMKKKGMTQTEIAKSMEMTTSQLRARISIATNEKKMEEAAFIMKLRDKGVSWTEIGKRLGVNESTVRSKANPLVQARTKLTKNAAEALKDSLKENTYLDVGKSTELYMGISRTRLETALEMLKMEGYEVYNIKSEQLGTGKFTTMQILCPPGTTYREVNVNRDKIKSMAKWSDDGGKSYLDFVKPKSISSERVEVIYGDQGGLEKDGLIELRPGVEDISLGGKRYAQVRIAVDDSHFLKGMAVYSDNLPKGVDVRFNTNKKDTGNKLDAMKPFHNDEANPFKTSVKQRHYFDKDGVYTLSAINIVNEEGDWGDWKKNLSSQVLSKQAPALAKKQLAIGYDFKQSQYDEIMSLTNPALKKKLLTSFADECDSSAVHLEAAGLPRQQTHVILPFSSIKDTEVYAPNYKDGEKVVLIRYPHGGIFEIPELTVNNKNPEAKKVISNSSDAIGINSKTAGVLSGADFDGDFVLVIPNKKGPGAIKTKQPFEELKSFDPKVSYPKYEGMKVLEEEGKQAEMGKISNLITDMTIKGADDDEIIRAVKHSMVVIDAVKHELDYKRSYREQNISELKKKYQGSAQSGASTIISRAGGQAWVNKRRISIDPETGEKVFNWKHEPYTNKKGETKVRKIKSTQMYETSDAFSLSSGTPIENVYAAHANKLKALANQARKQAAHIKPTPVSPSAKKTYAPEVEALEGKLMKAKMHQPLERQANLLSNSIVAAKRKDNPELTKDDLKKIKNQALNEARARVGAKKKDVMVEITPREWEAIQAGAISTHKLTEILNNTDETKVKEYALPKTKVAMPPAKVSRAKAMLNAGCTQAEVAERLGVSVSTLTKALA